MPIDPCRARIGSGCVGGVEWRARAPVVHDRAEQRFKGRRRNVHPGTQKIVTFFARRVDVTKQADNTLGDRQGKSPVSQIRLLKVVGYDCFPFSLELGSIYR